MANKNGSRPTRLTLPEAALQTLKAAGIRCTPEIGLEHQKTSGRYVLRGRESGGATKDIGRYVSFCADGGQQLPWFMRPDSLTVNSEHAIVIAPELVSIEMFRYQHTYELLIMRHTLEGEKVKRPEIRSTLVFRGHQGQLPLDLIGSDKHLAGSIAPEFFDRSGEPLQIPAPFVAAVHAVTKGVNCVDCKHAHLLVAKTAAVTSPLPLPDRKHSFASAPSDGPVTLAANTAANGVEPPPASEETEKPEKPASVVA